MSSSDSIRPSIAPSRARLVASALIVIALVALAVAWSVGPLARLLDPHRIAVYEAQVRGWPLAPLVVVAAYVVAGLIAAPVTLMIGATVLLFGAWPGAAYAFAGMMVSALGVYAIGRLVARDLVDRWLAARGGSKLAAFNQLLARRGLIAVALIRLTPIPFSLQNATAGASRVGVAHFVLGTAIGIVPVIALMAGVAAEFDAWLAHPDWLRLLGLIAAILVVLAIGWSLRRWALRNATSRE